MMPRANRTGALFVADITEVVITHLDAEATKLVVESWTPGERGLRTVESGSLRPATRRNTSCSRMEPWRSAQISSTMPGMRTRLTDILEIEHPVMFASNT